MRATLVLALLLGGCTTAAALPAQEPAPAARPRQNTDAVAPGPVLWTAIDEVAHGELQRQELVGLAVGIVHGGAVAYVQGYGHEDREAGTPVDPHATLFRWASMSKMLAGVVATALASEHLLDLDAPIEGILAGYQPPTSYLLPCEGARLAVDGVTQACLGGFAGLPLAPEQRRITARRLAGHLAGAAHYANGRGSPSPPPRRAGNPAVNTGMEWALPLWTRQPLVAIPGERFSYSTPGFNLLGVVLEKAAHRSLAALVEDRIARPLALGSLQPDYEWRNLPRRAVGYDRKGTVVRGPSTDVSWKLAGGGFISTVADVAGFCAGLAGDRLLTPAQKEIAWTSQRNAAGQLTGYGMGFRVGGEGRGRSIGHGGAQEKARTVMRLYPASGLCMVVMSNSTYADVDRVLNGLDAVMRPRPLTTRADKSDR